MLGFIPADGKSSSLGCFFVSKKSGALRSIFDTGKLNRNFKDPLSVDLPTSSAFSSVEVEPGLEAWL